MRADAQRNRQRLLDVAVELVLQAGGEPSRDAIAERAGVGIGTLYRHFPDRQALLHAVARHALENTIGAGETIVQSGSSRADALRQYMHAALDNGIGVVNMIHPLLEKRDWPDLRARAAALLKTLLARAVKDEKLVGDVSERDIVFATIRFARPLAIGLSASQERAIAHRHLDIYIDGLFSRTGAQPRSGATKT
ncbi:AcrR family transcriptional regulator [Variovorax boronicumulans]|uniref:TetR/AcrR family transcriptional regulator n=1 Tax=Variovorax boronicumulans TaxID=436515 RepID=UPI002473D7A5|nr:helix-turn-helix domain-containing protein [Variovorax boronicumulans]MDH6170069.1 AcrR family transcriptional regulator [Variovorax boronicumulans]